MNDYGTPDALTILPYWTNGCIGSMEGLYYEASATTPFHFLDQNELSLQPSNPMVGLPYGSAPNVALGVEHLQMLGVKYYMALNTAIQKQADADPSLKLISTFGPYAISYYRQHRPGPNGHRGAVLEALPGAQLAPRASLGGPAGSHGGPQQFVASRST